MATVNQRPITADQLASRYEAWRARNPAASPQQALDQLVDEELLVADALARSLGKSPAVAEAELAGKREAAAERYLEKDLYGQIKPDDAMLRRLYHETGDSAELRLIVVATADEAQTVLRRLDKGAKFEDEAKHSLNPRAAATGGRMANATRGSLDPELRDLAFSAPLNKPVGPVALKLGFGVMQVTGRRIADEKEFAARAPQLARFATEQMRAALRRHLVDQLKRGHEVRVDEDFLKATGTNATPSRAEADHVVASADDRQVRYGTLVEVLARSFGRSAGGHMLGFQVKRDVAWKLVESMLIELAAEKAGHLAAPEVAAAGEQRRRAALLSELAGALAREVPAPSREDKAAYLAAHAQEFAQPAGRTCWHVLVPTREKAQAALKRLARGEKLEELARAISVDAATAPRGGLMGRITDEALAALQDSSSERALAAALKPARAEVVDGPIQSSRGWHLVRCSAPGGPRLAPLEEVDEELTARMRREREKGAVAARAQVLRRQATVKVDDAAVQRAVAGPTPGVGR